VDVTHIELSILRETYCTARWGRLALSGPRRRYPDDSGVAARLQLPTSTRLAVSAWPRLDSVPVFGDESVVFASGLSQVPGTSLWRRK